MNLFVIYVENTNSAPKNYKTAIDNLKAINNKEIYIYVENYYKDRYGNVNTDRYVRYIQKYFSKGTEISNLPTGGRTIADSKIYFTGKNTRIHCTTKSYRTLIAF